MYHKTIRYHYHHHHHIIKNFRMLVIFKPSLNGIVYTQKKTFVESKGYLFITASIAIVLLTETNHKWVCMLHFLSVSLPIMVAHSKLTPEFYFRILSHMSQMLNILYGTCKCIMFRTLSKLCQLL